MITTWIFGSLKRENAAVSCALRAMGGCPEAGAWEKGIYFVTHFYSYAVVGMTIHVIRENMPILDEELPERIESTFYASLDDVIQDYLRFSEKQGEQPPERNGAAKNEEIFPAGEDAWGLLQNCSGPHIFSEMHVLFRKVVQAHGCFSGRNTSGCAGQRRISVNERQSEKNGLRNSG